MKKSLIEFLGELTDHRRGAGQRHKLEYGILIIIMSIMSGYVGIRAMGDFVERNKDDLLKALHPLKPRLPSFSTLRRILIQIDFAELKDIFYRWSMQYVEMGRDDYFSIDGKSIRSTISDYSNEMQNFVSMVSVFSQKRKQVITQEKYQSKKTSEIGIVQGLLEELDLAGITITMDALHAQKKH